MLRSLPFVTSFATLRTVQYSLLHAKQFASCCCKCHTVSYSLLLSAATCRTVAIYCHMPYSCYVLLHSMQPLFCVRSSGYLYIAACCTLAICCHQGGCLHFLPHARQLLFVASYMSLLFTITMYIIAVLMLLHPIHLHIF